MNLHHIPFTFTQGFGPEEFFSKKPWRCSQKHSLKPDISIWIVIKHPSTDIFLSEVSLLTPSLSAKLHATARVNRKLLWIGILFLDFIVEMWFGLGWHAWRARRLSRSSERVLVKSSCHQQRNFWRLRWKSFQSMSSRESVSRLSRTTVSHSWPPKCVQSAWKVFIASFEPSLSSHRTIYAEKAWFLDREKRCSEWSFSSISFCSEKAGKKLKLTAVLSALLLSLSFSSRSNKQTESFASHLEKLIPGL